MNIQELTRQQILLFDGAMGTMLQARGMEPGALPELLNLSHPDLVTGIHAEYVAAGAQIITANTFQANELKLGEHSLEQVVEAGVQCARRSGAPWVALDVGPLGQLLEPMGTLRFERAVELFSRIMIAGEAAGADLVVIETIADLYEAKAAILAARENTDLPVVCTMTFQEDGRTFVGCDALTATLTLQGLGVDALGVNCSLGPDQLMPVVETMLQYATVPVMVQANAGLPAIRDGKTVFDITPEQYAQTAGHMLQSGVRLIGGCCGTDPGYIRRLAEAAGRTGPVRTDPLRVTGCTCATGTVILDDGVTVIGERINPTGKKKLKEALRNNDIGYLISEAIDQEKAGSDVLDVNVGLPELDEPAMLARAVREIQGVVQLPLQIDSADSAAIEAAVRIYNGKPIINSANGKREIMEQIFPIAKKYGALVVCLTLDEDGIPPTAKGRLEIAQRIHDTAVNEYGLAPQDLLMDCLVLTASAQQDQVIETLRAIQLVKQELNVKTVLGVSNVSFGLPKRELLNATFLAAAFGAGLDAPILNPLSARYMEVVDSFRVLNAQDRDAIHYIESNSGADPDKKPADPHSAQSLQELIELGRADLAAETVTNLLAQTDPLQIIDGEFIPALNSVGKRFETGELFLPQLMRSAQAVQAGFEVIRDHMLQSGVKRSFRGRIVLATVQGDIHDIGKNIVRMLLENYGYEVLDLGKDVPIDQVVSTIRDENIRLAGLSALMTTTVTAMKDTIAAVQAAGLDCSFFVGGAVLNEQYTDFVGAQYYARDAMESVAIANRFFEGGA